MHRPTLALVSLLVLGACAEADRPFEPALDAPAFALVDGSTTGNEAFFFLPPMVPDPSPAGVFDGSLEPEVVICAVAAGSCDGVVAHFTVDTGPGSETVRVDADAEHYIVNWHTDDHDLDPAVTYRITVWVGLQALGYADVDVVRSGKELKNVDTGEFIALKDGRTLPIKFRIEEGALSTCEPVVFADAALEQVVRDAVGQPTGDILQDAVAGLARIDAANRGIADLTGIECLPDLTTLLIGGNPIADLGPLAGVEGLAYLAMQGNTTVTDLGPLAGLTGLTHFLCAACTGLTDLGPLAASTGMVQIDLYTVPGIASLAPLAGMTGMTWLRVGGAAITDLSPLDDLDQLSFLDLRGSPFADLSPLAGATGMTQFLMGPNAVTDLSPMAGWTALRLFRSGGIPGVTDLGVFAGFSQLDFFWIESFPGVTDLSPLSGLPALRDVTLRTTGVTDLSPLAGVSSLRRLDVPGVADISPVSSLTGLTYLSVSQIDPDLGPVAALTDLEELWVQESHVTDLTPLSGLTDLRRLELNRSYSLTDLSPLTSLPSLARLSVRESDVSDTSPLPGIALLDFLDIRSNPVDCGTDTVLSALAAGGVTVLTDCF